MLCSIAVSLCTALRPELRRVCTAVYRSHGPRELLKGFKSHAWSAHYTSIRHWYCTLLSTICILLLVKSQEKNTQHNTKRKAWARANQISKKVDKQILIVVPTRPQRPGESIRQEPGSVQVQHTTAVVYRRCDNGLCTRQGTNRLLQLLLLYWYYKRIIHAWKLKLKSSPDSWTIRVPLIVIVIVWWTHKAVFMFPRYFYCTV